MNNLRQLRDEIKRLVKNNPTELRSFLLALSKEFGITPLYTRQWTILWPTGIDSSRTRRYFGFCTCGALDFNRRLQVERLRISVDQNRPCSHQSALPPQPPRIKTQLTVEVNGVSHTLKEWFAISGISHQAYYSRLVSGWPRDFALSTPKGEQPLSMPISIGNQTRSLQEWSDHLQQTPKTVLIRIKRGIPLVAPKRSGRPGRPRTILGAPYIIDSNTIVEINGIEKTEADWLKQAGLSFDTYRSRILRGWRREWALLTPPTKVPLDMPIESQGETHTVKEWAAVYLTSPRVILRRATHGIHLWAKPTILPVPEVTRTAIAHPSRSLTWHKPNVEGVGHDG